MDLSIIIVSWNVDTFLNKCLSSIYRNQGNLKLEVIETGRVPRAFINGKLLTIGDRLAVSDGIKRYEYEVLRIDKTTVWLRCGKAEVQLKIVQTTETGSQ